MTKFATILCDPPWPEHGGGKIKRGADRHYPLMSVKEIAALPVGQLAALDCHLYLWATNNYLQAAFEVVAKWNQAFAIQESKFEYISNITWVKMKDGKPQVGLGQYYRGATEQLLFFRRGQPPYKVVDGKRQQGLTVIFAPRGEHSAKPEEARRMIERVSPGPFVEIFARVEVEGWSRFGNEVESNVELGVPAQADMFA